MTNTDNAPEATFPCNKFYGIRYLYRDDEFFTTPEKTPIFYRLVERSNDMISASFGWSPNRAWKIYEEAFEENERIDKLIAETAIEDMSDDLREALDIQARPHTSADWEA